MKKRGKNTKNHLLKVNRPLQNLREQENSLFIKPLNTCTQMTISASDAADNGVNL